MPIRRSQREGWREVVAGGWWVALLTVLLGACGRNSLPEGPFGCLDNESVCAGVCIDTSNSSEHCGGCGNACGENEECIASKCRPICSADETLCAVGCVDLERDPEHCGACKNACAPGDMCVDGVCRTVACPGVHMACDGACVNPQTDPNHCGGCSIRCDEGWMCAGGLCRSTCRDTLCDAECVDLRSDPSHCGGCGFTCGADERCAMGQCVTTCPAGMSQCGNGCVELANDPRHCGSCFNVCAGSCSEGLCQPVCEEPEIDCGDGCFDPRVDRAHCGGCDIACAEGLECRQEQCLAPSDTCDWSTAQFPFQIQGSLRIGDLTVDKGCTLYVALAHEYYDLGALYSIGYDSGEVALIGPFTDQIYRVIYRPEDDLLYLASFEQVYVVARDGSSGGALTSEAMTPYLTSLGLIPEGWGSFGSQLLVGNSVGDLVALDPDDPKPVALASLPEGIVDFAFVGSTLYVMVSPLPFDVDEGELYQVSPSGEVTPFVELSCIPTALATDGESLYVACSYGDGIHQIDLPSGSTSAIYAADLYRYWGPGLLWDNEALLMFGDAEGSNVTIDAYFP